jgi:hypothetical protein
VKQFKIVLIYQVMAEDRMQALELFTNAKAAHRENAYFEAQSIKELEVGKATGWTGTHGKQLFGK